MSQTDASFVAICDDDAQRADRAAATYHARWPFHGFRTLLTEAQPQAVVLAAPLAQRADLVRRCLAQGVCTLVIGLPVAPRPRWPVRSGAFVWAASPLRFSPVGVLARRLIDSGKVSAWLGGSLSAAWPRNARQRAVQEWPVSPDHVFEAVDWIEHLCGPTRELFARAHPDGAVVATLVSNADVPVAVALHEHGSPDHAGMALELRGTDAERLCIAPDLRLTCAHGARIVAGYAPPWPSSDPSQELGYAGLLREFLRRVNERKPAAAKSAETPAAWRTTQSLLSALTRSGAVRVSDTQAQ